METNEFINIDLDEADETSEETVIGEPVTEVPRPFLTTPFEDYTVTEGLLLAVLICLFIFALVRILKEGFYWLL